MAGLTIGQVARKTGMTVEGVRFYEGEDLIEPPPRKPSGYREYPDTVISRLRFIRQAKELGFSLREVKELLSLRVDRLSNRGETKALTAAKVADIEEKIATLQRWRRTLKTLLAACDECCSTMECPILDALEEKPLSTSKRGDAHPQSRSFAEHLKRLKEV